MRLGWTGKIESKRKAHDRCTDSRESEFLHLPAPARRKQQTPAHPDKTGSVPIPASARDARYPDSVRSAGYGAGDYDAAAYIEHSNETELVIPLAEDFEFIENIDEILSVEGLEIVNFGPVDFALSKNKVFCGMDMPEIVDALTTIIEKCRAKNISVMVPGIPPTYESVKSIIDMGANMLAVGTDIMHFNNGLRTVKENVVSKFQS